MYGVYVRSTYTECMYVVHVLGRLLVYGVRVLVLICTITRSTPVGLFNFSLVVEAG